MDRVTELEEVDINEEKMAEDSESSTSDSLADFGGESEKLDGVVSVRGEEDYETAPVRNSEDFGPEQLSINNSVSSMINSGIKR
jgi:hypothetical protein